MKPTLQHSTLSTFQHSNSSYLLVINGKPAGPFTVDELKAMPIKPGDFVRTAEMDDYKEAHEIEELRQFLGFSRQALIPQYFGGFDQRLLASALDWFFVSGACMVPAFLVTLFIPDQAIRISIAFGLLALIPLVNFIYHIVMECSVSQGTFGKQIIKIKVCDMEGKQLTFARSAGRNAAKIFSVLTFFIGYLFLFFSKQQQCLHDMIAGTLVMKDRLF